MLFTGSLTYLDLIMAQKRKHFKKGILEASTNPHRNIFAKRLIMEVRYSLDFIPNIISTEAVGIRKELH
jgi:hypothetical protein